MDRLPTLAVLGLGNMGEALVKSILDRGLIPAAEVLGVEKSSARAEQMAARYAISAGPGAADAVARAQVVLLAIKPQDVDALLDEISGSAEGKLVVSVCAGVPLARLAGRLPGGTAVARVMPNTPALVGCGASVYCVNEHATAEDLSVVEALLGAVGEVHRVEREELLDAVTGLSGSGPAFAFLFLEALADGGVLAGLPRDLARALAAQTLLGSARLAQGTGEHTAELKDRVASPGGTTAAGLRELELRGFRGAIIEAVRAAARRSRELGG